MPIVVSCSACNVRLTLGDDRAGDRFECPNCDATIKVPAAEQPPARAPAAMATVGSATTTRPTRPRKPDPEPEPEMEPEAESGPDKRIVGGIIAGAVGLFVVVVAIGLVAFRKPTETAKPNTEPSTPAVSTPAPASTPPKDPSGVAPPVRTPTQVEPPRQPAPGEPVPVPQFTAQFLGSQGQGRRFCIIADNSGSMAGAKIADLRVQLLKTLTDLNTDGEFYVFCFNSKPEPMPHPTWVRAGAPEAEKIKTWVKAINTRGGTVPAPAFEAAFKLSPPPDVIFFMTDGQFSSTVPARVVELNGTPRKSVVNTIMFATGPAPKVPVAAPKGAEGVLRQIAEQNGGTFTRYAPP